MSLGHPDFQRIEQWLGGALAEEIGYPLSAGLDAWGPFNVASWRTVALAVLPTGSDITVQVTWSHSSIPFMPLRQDVYYVKDGRQLFALCPIYADTVELTVGRGGGATSIELGLWPTNLEHDNGTASFTGVLAYQWPIIVPAGLTSLVYLPPYAGRSRLNYVAGVAGMQMQLESMDHLGNRIGIPWWSVTSVGADRHYDEIYLPQGINRFSCFNSTGAVGSFFFSLTAIRD